MRKEEAVDSMPNPSRHSSYAAAFAIVEEIASASKQSEPHEMIITRSNRNSATHAAGSSNVLSLTCEKMQLDVMLRLYMHYAVEQREREREKEFVAKNTGRTGEWQAGMLGGAESVCVSHADLSALSYLAARFTVLACVLVCGGAESSGHQ